MQLTEYNPSPKPHDEEEENYTLQNGLRRILTTASTLKNNSKQLVPHHDNQEVALTFSSHDYIRLQGTMLTELKYNSLRFFVAQHNCKHTKPSMQRNLEGIGSLQKMKVQVLTVNLAAICLPL